MSLAHVITTNAHVITTKMTHVSNFFQVLKLQTIWRNIVEIYGIVLAYGTTILLQELHF